MTTRSSILHRLTVAALTFGVFVAGVSAQDKETDKKEPQDPVVTTPVKPGDPLQEEKTGVAKPVDRVAELKDQLSKLETEMSYIKKLNENGGLASRVKGRLDRRGLSPKAVKDTSPKREVPPPIATPEPAPKGTIRLLGDDEKAKLGDDVVFTVDSVPVTKAEFDGLFNYLKTFRSTASDEELSKDAVRALVKNKAAEAAFSAQLAEARATIAQAKSRIDSGEDFATVAKELSQCPSREQGGSLGSVPRYGFDDVFAMKAFQTKTGEVTDIVQTAFGFHLIKVTGRTDGDEPSQDTVEASHILSMFDDDQMAVRSVMGRADQGQVELAFVNDAWRQKSPF